ncbi:hypothetical protein GCM10010106_32990 [Thermopolyspora flexuosa]|nr:hypothetical protein GCM10010106_32990 [Thermopolyspora flexuosa]
MSTQKVATHGDRADRPGRGVSETCRRPWRDPLPDGHPRGEPPEEAKTARAVTYQIKADRPGVSADDILQSIAQGTGLIRRELDDEPPATLQGDPHDYAPSFLGDLQRTVAGPRLHRRHACYPFLLLDCVFPTTTRQ